MTAQAVDPLDVIAEVLLVQLDDHLEGLVRSDRASERHRAAIAAITTALSQVRSGTYGTCLGCERPIEAARLAVEPEASTCGACRHHPRALIG